MSSRRHKPTQFARMGPVALVALTLLLVFSGVTAAMQRPRDRNALPSLAGVTIPPRPIVRFAPDPVQVGLGQTSQVDIVIENAVGLYAAEIHISFPAHLVQVQDAYPGVEGIQISPGNFFNGFDTYTIQNRVDSGANLIEYIVSITGSPVGVTGQGTLATISLFGQSPDTAMISFEEVILCERNGTSMMVHLPNEQVTVSVVGQTSTPTVTNTSMATNTQTSVVTPSATATLTTTVTIPAETVTPKATNTGTITATMTVSPTLTSTPTETSVLATPTPICSDAIDNGGFEVIVANNASPWVRTGATTFTSVEHRSGAYSAWLAGYNGANDGLYQDVSIPGHTLPGEQLTQAILRYSWGMFTEELSHPFDFMRVNVRDQSGTLLEQIEEVTDGSETGSWQDREFDLSAYEGQDIRVSFEVAADGTNVTSFYVDDVSLELCEIIMPSPTVTSAVTETATMTATVTGTVTVMATPTQTLTPIPVTDPITDTFQQKDGLYVGCEDSYFSAWDSPPTNYGAQGAMSIRTAGVKRPVLHFDLPDSMSGATVLHATLSLYTSHYKSHAQDMSVGVYGLKKRFAEMETTWDNATESAPWSLGGADSVGDDRDDVAQDTILVADINSWNDWDVTALVQAWLNGSRANDGMLLIADGNTVEMSFWSSEYSLPDLRPKLTIQYAYGGQPPEPSPTSEYSPTPGPSPTSTTTPTPVLGGTTVTYQQNQLGYQGVDDTYLSSWQPETNYGNSVSLLIRQGDVRSAVILFDGLNLPANAVIHEAKLQLYAADRSNSGNLTIDAYAVTKRWIETQTTWNLARVGIPWGLPGCNLVGSDRGDVVLDSTVANTVDEWFEWDITPIVQDWVSGQSPNRGVILKGTGMTSVEYLFASSEYWWAQGLTPRLVVRYSAS